MSKLLKPYLKKIAIALLFTCMFIAEGIAQKAAPTIIQTIETALEQYDLETSKEKLEEAFATLPYSSNPDLHSTLLVLQSKWHFAKGNYAVALSTIEEASTIVTENRSIEHFIKVQDWKARCFIEWQELEKADTILTEALKLYQESNLKNPPLYNSLQYHLGLLKISQHQYTIADSIFTKLLENPVFQKEQYLIYYQVQYQLAESKLEQEQFDIADSLLIVVRSEMEHNFGKKHFLMPNVWNHIGRVTDKKGQHKVAADAYQKALNIAAERQGLTHPIYGKILYNFGNSYLDVGNYEQAEAKLLQAKNIYYNTFKATPRYAFMIAGLEELYRKLGQTDKELAYSIEQKNIFKQNARLIDYARVINNLSYIYQDQGQIDTANYLLKNAIEDLVKAKKTTTGLYALLLMNYAGLNIDLGNYAVSEKHFEEAQQLLATIYGTTHPWYAAVINNLAFLYETTGKYAKAKILYLETEEIDRTTLGEKHPYYTHTQYKLANINRLTKDSLTALQHFQIANNGQINLIYNYYSGFDEATRLDYLKKTEEQFHRFFSFAFDQQQAGNNINKEVQNINLAIKNLALDFSANNQELANEIVDTSIASVYAQYLEVKKSLSKNYILSTEELAVADIDIKSLEEQAEFLEKELVRNEVLSQSRLSNQKRLAYDDLHAVMKKDEAVIDILHFPYYLPERKTDSTYYVAIFNRTTLDEPKMVFLGEEKELLKMLRPRIRRNGGNYIANQQIAKDLYEQIWQPLEPYLKDVHTIAISPSGLLHKLAFGALPYAAGQYLTDKYRFTYHGNLRAKINAIETASLNKSIALMGGANFDLDSLQLTALAQQLSKEPIADSALPSQDLASTSISLPADTSLRAGIVFNYLPGTKAEVQQIAQQFKTNEWQVQALVGNALIEENFKNQSGKAAPSVLHIATHGYFFGPLKKGKKVPDNARGRIMSAKNPLLRSGLALSGANYAWKLGKQIPNLEDGILTAYEIANQNLGNTDLVVLSACETGRGDVVNGEGVFGLQRAFKMAGAKKLITSLWKVPDQQTTELMVLFYKYYLATSDAAAALHQAQQAMQKKYPPFYWASFVLIE